MLHPHSPEIPCAVMPAASPWPRDAPFSFARDPLCWHACSQPAALRCSILIRPRFPTQALGLIPSADLLGAQEKHNRLDPILVGVLQVLSLSDVVGTCVGNEEIRGVSGGQKRRVNIGVELVADTPLLFLDEPTSGLGATDTLIVMKALRSLVQIGRTVAAVIHQPRSEVFDLFDTALFLGMRGRVVYFGPTNLTSAYFSFIGFKTPNDISPADFYMDVLGGLVERDGDPSFTTYDLPVLYSLFMEADTVTQMTHLEPHLPTLETGMERKQAQMDHFTDMKQRIEQEWGKLDNDISGSVNLEELWSFLHRQCGMDLEKQDCQHLMQLIDKDGSGSITMSEFLSFTMAEVHKMRRVDHTKSTRARGMSGNWASGEAAEEDGGNKGARGGMAVGHGSEHPILISARQFLWQVFVVLSRSSTQRLRLLGVFILDSLLVLLGSLIISTVIGSDWSYEDIQTNSWLSTVSLGILCCIGSLRIFGAEHVIRVREQQSGVMPISFWVAKTLSELPDLVTRPAIFTVVYMNIVLPEESAMQLFREQVAVCWACGGMGMLVSMLFSPATALLPGVLLPLITGVFFAGVEPSLKSMSPFMKTIATTSFTRWAVEAIVLSETEQMPDHLQPLKDDLLDDVGYESGNHDKAIRALVMMGLVFRVSTYLVMSIFPRPALIGQTLSNGYHTVLAWSRRHGQGAVGESAAATYQKELGGPKKGRAVSLRTAPGVTSAPSSPQTSEVNAIDDINASKLTIPGHVENTAKISQEKNPLAKEANQNFSLCALADGVASALQQRRRVVLDLMYDELRRMENTRSDDDCDVEKVAEYVGYLITMQEIVEQREQGRSSSEGSNHMLAAMILPLQLIQFRASSMKDIWFNHMLCSLAVYKLPLQAKTALESSVGAILDGIDLLRTKLLQNAATKLNCEWGASIVLFGAFVESISVAQNLEDISAAMDTFSSRIL
ncbi:hypothetical protein CYMTET_51616 [Cymbomonas tetramitiformis]|uniref:EF-hand domain-containing protein n=1 Tax=Cymbomonas tetramitiformis TaxID=36881 RepID=A0AAE0BKS6_9CHLO|nr:hypothetical protein CYMTET_51616 [Cymbomonas tetramitiformis]